MKVEKKVTYHVGYSEVERAITDYFTQNHGFSGEYYEIPDLEEASNGVSLEFNIDGKLSDREQEDIDKAIQAKTFSKSKWRTRLFLDYLCKNGVIEPGDYVIRVSW